MSWATPGRALQVVLLIRIRRSAIRRTTTAPSTPRTSPLSKQCQCVLVPQIALRGNLPSTPIALIRLASALTVPLSDSTPRNEQKQGPSLPGPHCSGISVTLTMEISWNCWYQDHSNWLSKVWALLLAMRRTSMQCFPVPMEARRVRRSLSTLLIYFSHVKIPISGGALGRLAPVGAEAQAHRADDQASPSLPLVSVSPTRRYQSPAQFYPASLSAHRPPRRS